MGYPVLFLWGFVVIQRREQNLALVSLMYEGSCLLLVGGTYVSMNLEMFSVAKLQLLTSGLGFLCVFFRKYNISSVLVLCGSIKKLYCLLVICLFRYTSFSTLLMFWTWVVVGSVSALCRLLCL